MATVIFFKKVFTCFAYRFSIKFLLSFLSVFDLDGIFEILYNVYRKENFRFGGKYYEKNFVLSFDCCYAAFSGFDFGSRGRRYPADLAETVGNNA